VPFGRGAKRVEYVTEVTQRDVLFVQHQAIGPVMSSGLEGHHHAAHRETPIERLSGLPMTTLSAITSSLRPAVAEAKQFGSLKWNG
jgi:hypothetical protein